MAYKIGSYHTEHLKGYYLWRVSTHHTRRYRNR